ncbi:hypothetical protein JW921_05565, partial [Candidatus Fermentibacterales bacterium]|nr:hypothetical protein [Candidatus Fermentibacterales bacterium]
MIALIVSILLLSVLIPLTPGESSRGTIIDEAAVRDMGGYAIEGRFWGSASYGFTVSIKELQLSPAFTPGGVFTGAYMEGAATGGEVGRPQVPYV